MMVLLFTMKPVRAMVKAQIGKESFALMKCSAESSVLRHNRTLLATRASVLTLASVGICPTNLCTYTLILLQRFLLVVSLILYISACALSFSVDFSLLLTLL